MSEIDPEFDYEVSTAIARVHELHSDVLTGLTGNATIAERDTWPVKEAAARAILGNTASEADMFMLGVEAQLSGREVVALCQTIVAKSDSFKMLIGKAAGMRDQGLKALARCSSMAELDATVIHIEQQAIAAIAEIKAGGQG